MTVRESDGTTSVFTFGGDRETFNPTDPLNYLNVDNDVWKYSYVPEPSCVSLGYAFLMGMLIVRRRPSDT